MVARADWIFPAGTLLDFAGSSAPSGWHLCDGSAVSRTTYAALFSAIGTTYGVGDGSTTFNLPLIEQPLPDTDWASLAAGAFAANWSGYASSGWPGVMYRRVGGVVTVTGAAIKTTTMVNGETVFTMPTGFRPGYRGSAFRAQSGSVLPIDFLDTGAAVLQGAGTGTAFSFLATYPVASGGYRVICLGATSTTPAEPAEGEVLEDAAVWQPGQSAWDFLNPLVQSIGKRLWCDEQRVWHLSDPLDGTAGSVNLTPILTEAADTIDRAERWHDSVVIRYRWTDSGGEQHQRFDTASTAAEDEHTRTLSIDYDRAYPGAGAAASILSRVKGRGRALTPQAVSRYDVAPGMAAIIALPDTPLQTGIVSSVEWRLPEDEMRVGTRDLTDSTPYSWVAQPAGLAWTDIDPGTDWSEYEPE